MLKQSAITLIILFFFLGGFSNASLGYEDFDIDNAKIEFKYEKNESRVAMQSYSSDQNDLKTEWNSQNNLYFYVIGAPLLVDSSPELTSTSLSNFFRLNHNGFSLFFNTFNNAQKLVIAKRIMSIYKVNVSISQIITFKLDELKCTTMIYCNNQSVDIHGKADSFLEYPIEVKFNTNKSTRACLQQYLNVIQMVVCDYVRYSKRSSELVSYSRLNQKDLVVLLFENVNKIYMTRQQLADLANFICLNYCQDYVTGKSVINLEDFISENNIEFKQWSFDYAFNLSSKYFNINNINKTEIRSIYENAFKVERSLQKSKIYIGINYQMMPKIMTSLLSSLGIAESYNYVRDNEKYWSESTKTLDEQLKELNSYSRNDIEWKIVGNKILPQRLNLMKLKKSSFQDGLKFNLFDKVVGNISTAATSFDSKDGKIFFLFTTKNLFKM